MDATRIEMAVHAPPPSIRKLDAPSGGEHRCLKWAFIPVRNDLPVASSAAVAIGGAWGGVPKSEPAPKCRLLGVGAGSTLGDQVGLLCRTLKSRRGLASKSGLLNPASEAIWQACVGRIAIYMRKAFGNEVPGSAYMRGWW